MIFGTFQKMINSQNYTNKVIYGLLFFIGVCLHVHLNLQLSRMTLFNLLTSFSIHGLPRHVAKQPNSPKTMIVVPVPMRTYGALVEFSAISEIYVPKVNFPQIPTARRITPVIWKIRSRKREA